MNETETTNKCRVCYRDIPEGTSKQYGASMYYQDPFTCSTACYNKDWLRTQPVGSGWMPLVWKAYNKLNNLYGKDEWRVAQIKEKFGGLRFYFDPPRDEDGAPKDDSRDAWEIVGAIEDESFKTCEWCGEPGEQRTGGWILTLCDGCCGERGKKRKEYS